MTLPTGRITLKTIAAEANCSVAQVSAVLNNSRGGTVVSEARRAAIKAIAEKLGYRPNFASQALKRQSMHTIGIYIEPGPWSSLGSFYENTIYQGIEEYATNRGYDILVFNMSSKVSTEECARKLEEARCDGVILFRISPRAAWVKQLLAHRIKCAAVECGEKIPELCRVRFDEEAAIRMALENLSVLGHRRVGFLGVACPDVQPPKRAELFRRFAPEFSCDADPKLIFDHTHCREKLTADSDYSQRSGILGMRYFHKMKNPPTAILCHDSLIAVSAMQEALSLGIRIPEDVSLVGIDHYSFLPLFRPGLTVVDHRLPELGHAAAKLLIDQIEGRLTAPEVFTILPAWLPGESCKQIMKDER